MKPKRLTIKEKPIQPNKLAENLGEIPHKSPSRVIKRYENSGMRLTHERAKDLYVRYNTEIKSDLENSRNERLPNAEDFRGTEYVWISRKRLKLYLRFLKELERLNPDQPEISGVSLYFGRIGYEDDNLFADTGEPENGNDEPKKVGDYRGRHTLFMAPTIRKEEIEGHEMLKHKAFYIDSEHIHGIERYTGAFKVLPFLEEVPFPGEIIIPGEGGEPDGGDPGDDGTSVLSNDLNNMPPMSS